MDLGEMVQQCVEDSSRWFPGEAQSLANLVLCLAGEVGETANIVKKVVRGSLTIEQAITEKNLPEEIIDCLIYLCNLMGNKEFANVDWEAIWNEKRQFNEARFNPAKVIAEYRETLPEEMLGNFYDAEEM